MADQLPLNIAIPPEQVLATYSYTDLAEGTGVQQFNCFGVENGTAKAWVISNFEVFGNPVETTASTHAGYFFETSEFNAPRTIKGTGYADLSIIGGATSFAYVGVYKNDGVSADTTDTINTTHDANGSPIVSTFAITSEGTFISRINSNGTGALGDIYCTITKNGDTVAYALALGVGGTGYTFAFTKDDYTALFEVGDAVVVTLTNSNSNMHYETSATKTGAYATATNQDMADQYIFTKIDSYELLSMDRTPGTGGVSAKSYAIKLPMTQTNFKIGESIVMHLGTSGTTALVACNPQNTDTNSFTAADNHTSLNLYIPFKLNL